MDYVTHEESVDSIPQPACEVIASAVDGNSRKCTPTEDTLNASETFVQPANHMASNIESVEQEIQEEEFITERGDVKDDNKDILKEVPQHPFGHHDYAQQHKSSIKEYHNTQANAVKCASIDGTDEIMLTDDDEQTDDLQQEEDILYNGVDDVYEDEQMERVYDDDSDYDDVTANVSEHTQIELDSDQLESDPLSVNTNIVSGAVTAVTESGGNTPKMLQAKTKNNQLVMVQLVNENDTLSIKTNKSLEEKLSVSDAEQQPQQQQRLVRSNTPMVREILALQRSVNESKILSEFVTDTAVVKERKLRKSGAGSASSKEMGSVGERSSSAGEKHNKPGRPQRKSFIVNNISLMDEHVTAENLSDRKLQRVGSRFMPLKDDANAAEGNGSNALKPIRRSRSKSMNRKSPIISLEAAVKRLKRWPSEEKILKRTNMRSQNTEFVQKQMDFLHRVHHQQEDTTSDVDDDDEENYIHDSGGIVEDLDDSNATIGADDSSSLIGSYGSLSQSFQRHHHHHHHHQQQQQQQQQLPTPLLNTAEAVVNQGTNTSDDADSLEVRLKAIWQPPPKRGWDSFCWKCHECANLIPCSKCVRCFHTTCIKITAATKLDCTWVCPECVAVDNVLNGPKRTRRTDLCLDLLGQLLAFALKRMKNVKGYTKFVLSAKDLWNYPKYFVNPVTFATLQEKIEKKAFCCAEEFVNETKWMLHNALILSNGGTNSKETLTAKAILKICRQESNEIDTCAECYLNANTRSDWFVDVCAHPHLLLWAKLKGFPYWPAKAMGPGQGSHVNVRFFGEHDRAFVPIKDCFLYSEQDPNIQTGKRSARELADCIKEVEVHIEKIRAKIGDFKYAAYKTPYDPADELMQLECMMPGVGEYIKRHQALMPKPPLQYKIVKTADNHLSIIKKAAAIETAHSGDALDHAVMIKKKHAFEGTNETVATSPTTTNAAAGITAETQNNNGANNKVGKVLVTTSKYEVVSKTTSDDSSSSKVSTVILKRKSLGNECKKGEDIEMPMPKVTKIVNEIKVDEEQQQRLILLMNQSTTTATAKRKHGSLEPGNKESSIASSGHDDNTSDKHRSKHSKHDVRIPMLTIKTNGTKVAENAVTVETNATATTTELASAQPPNSVMENLVKNKQGVTIKKIPKESEKNINGSETSETSNAEAKVESDDKKNKQGNEDAVEGTSEMSKNTQTVTNILKDLVPFVEIKKEFPSDDEHGVIAGVNDTMTRQQQKQNEASTTLSGIALAVQEKGAVATTQSSAFLLTAVKEEVMSDEEEHIPRGGVVDKDKVQQDEKRTSSTISSDERIRVVGDTTIQRLSTKSNNAMVSNAQSNVYAGTTITTSTSVVSSLSNNNNAMSYTLTQSSGKRSSLRGVPYGPLPASATTNTTNTTPKTISVPNTNNSNDNDINHINTTLNLLQQQQSRQMQRARKSFPNRSPPDVSTARNFSGTGVVALPTNITMTITTTTTTTPTPATTTTTTTTSMLINSSGGITKISSSALPTSTAIVAFDSSKRSLLKTSTGMVSIPVDVASNRNSNNNNSIPVPPLTAVSKTTPNHNTSVSISQASVVTATNTAVNQPPPPVASPVVPSTIANSFVNYNGVTPILLPISLTAPPPLAGLSQIPINSSSNSTATAPTIPSTRVSSTTTQPIPSVLPSTVSINGQVESKSAASATVTTTALGAVMPSVTVAPATIPAVTVDGHLLGDLVTPTLASAITDVICRGPPKMAARPSGPLQSDGSTMFPSQAGPICRTLVENAHKLTDFFISVMEDTMCEMSVGDSAVLQAKITLLSMELERMKQAYEQEISELKHTSDLMLCEMRKSMEQEKTRIANEIRKQCELERLRSVEETKKKQWCAHCGREAQFYCCWNTSYCDYPCQQLHWSRHAANCSQARTNSTNVSETAASSSIVIGTTNSNTNSNSSMTTNVLQQQQQQERSHISKTTISVSTAGTGPTVASVHYNKNITGGSKKEKNAMKNNAAAINAMAMTATQAPATEVLKLPSNTYLRALPATASATNAVARNSNTYAMPIQRFNIPLPITAPGGPPYTIVQRGSSWELMSTSANANTGVAQQTLPVPTAISSSIQQQSQPHQQQTSQQSGRLLTNSLITKNSQRNRGGATAAANTSVVPLNTSSSALQCNLLRPSTQM